ncbi:MAG: MliC family protein [Paracoccus sp. (in: a-proteobacteria)]|nr:MliC family protein [Paracoccus sp. (in: a-proteobacteria)]
MTHLGAKLFLLAPLALAACMDDSFPEDRPAGNPTAAEIASWPLTPYNCANGYLDVRFSPSGDFATIDQMGERIVMRHVPSGSGARYAAIHPDYSYQLDTKGNDATLYEAGDKVVLRDCRAGG